MSFHIFTSIACWFFISKSARLFVGRWWHLLLEKQTMNWRDKKLVQFEEILGILVIFLQPK